MGRHAGAHLDAWLARACRCRIPAMVALFKIIRAHRRQILAAVIAMTYLCCSGLTVTLPTGR